MVQICRRKRRFSMATATIFVVTASLSQNLLIPAPNISSTIGIPCVEAFVPQFHPSEKRASAKFTTRLTRNSPRERKLLHSIPKEQRLTDACHDTTRNNCYEETNTNDRVQDLGVDDVSFILKKEDVKKRKGWKFWGEVLSMSVKHTSALMLMALLSATTPMPAMATFDTAITSIHSSTTDTVPISSSPNAFRESSLVVALEAQSPYTGQLVDTSGAKLVQLDSGVSYNDLRDGTGDVTAEEGKRVNIQWVLKRSNGYSIDSSAQNDGVPFIFVVGAGNTQKERIRAIPGLDEGIRGMKVGGIRRIVIPPSLAYVEGVGDDCPGPVPPGFGPKQRIKRVMENRMDVPDESFLLDVKLTRVQRRRNAVL